MLVTNINTSVINPTPEVRSSGTVPCRILYPFATDLYYLGKMFNIESRCTQDHRF